MRDSPLKIAFLSTSTNAQWNINTLKLKGLGGTEATCLRVAHGLALDFKVYLAQESRAAKEMEIIEQVVYCSPTQLCAECPDIVVIIADYKKATEIANRFKSSKVYLWLHNVPRWKLGLYAQGFRKSGISLIGVSDWHVDVIKRTLTRFDTFSRFKRSFSPLVHRIYNPVANELHPDLTPRNKKKFLFTSSPHKGLEEVVKKFALVQEVFQDIELYVANPGYNQLPKNLAHCINYLDELPHEEVIQHLRNTFCVFFPQTSHKETFGLVYAEANAVGTPVIAHNFGAAGEVLSGCGQAINCDNIDIVISTVQKWRDTYPSITGNPEFKLTSVLTAWRELFSLA